MLTLKCSKCEKSMNPCIFFFHVWWSQLFKRSKNGCRSKGHISPSNHIHLGFLRKFEVEAWTGPGLCLTTIISEVDGHQNITYIFGTIVLWQDDEEQVGLVADLDMNSISNGCLLLPKLVRMGLPTTPQEDTLFMLVDSEWGENQEDISIHPSTYFPHVCYDTTLL